MIKLRAMREDEFTGYLDYFIPDYANEIMANYGGSQQEALQKAKDEAATGLPQGVATKEQVLLCILLADQHVGYIWYRPQPDTQSVFILDFAILEQFRGNGYGRAAMRALEDHLKSDNVNQIGLRVAADNKAAQNLYLSGGFRATGINMIRQI